MRQTVVGVFEKYAAAQRAATELAESGFGPDAVQVTQDTQELLNDGAVRPASARPADEGITGHIRSFFAELFGRDDDTAEVDRYAEAVRRGGAVVKVEVAQDEAVETVRDALERAGAIDIDQQEEQWRASGWSGSSAMPSVTPGAGTAGQIGTAGSGMGSGIGSATTGMTGSSTGAMTGSMGATSVEGGVIPVVQEELQVGKRVVKTGGVRVYAHTVETPVEESVQLRSEHAQVERRPVDRAATAEDLAALGDRTIQIEETAEQAVVAKEARVVEEVLVGKTTEQHTERVQDTVRSTEVNVEQLAGDVQGARTGIGSGTGAGTTGMGFADDTSAGAGTVPISQRSFESLDPVYRQDFDQRYASQGGRYDDYQPAYRYGHSLAGDSRYSGRSWDEFEPEARRDWESRNPGGTWERMKAAVRHGWERMTS